MDNRIYRDVYNLHAECLDRLNEPDFWDSVFWPKAEALFEKHKHNLFLMGMVLEVHAEVERQRRKRDTKP